MGPPSRKFKSKEASISRRSKVSSQKLTAHVVEDDPDFPRGGKISFRKEHKVVRVLNNEIEPGNRLMKKKKKENDLQRRNLYTQDDSHPLFGGGITGKLPRFSNKITLKNVSPEMKFWGVIVEVNEKDIVVGLPGGLRGLVRASEAFDPIVNVESEKDAENKFLSSLFIGQLVPCVVAQVDDDKKEIAARKIWLSLRLSLLHKSLTLDSIQEGMVLSAYVKSIEDHGFILHFGLPYFAGFMPKQSKSEIVNEVNVGHLIQGFVKSVDKIRKVIHLSSDIDIVSKCVTKELKGISVDLLTPGMMVNAHVQSTLENGILLSFLTYFTGTVDVFNLDKTFPSPNWKDDYAKNMKFNARILFIDPSTRAIGLTMNPYLVNNKASPTLVKIGDIFDQSKVARVDKGCGLLLELPTSPVPTPAYVNVSDVADAGLKKWEKNYKEGNLVRMRIVGFRHLEGLASGILKASAFEGSVFTHSDVKPGMVVKAKVIAVDSFGAIVQLSSGVKALCPLRHMSEFETLKPKKKFQVGVELVFRVLGFKSKRITVTHKKTLVRSKLEILSSYADATDGFVTHGWITKIDNHGCFVRFYNGVQGFASRYELGLDPGSHISSLYHVEQVVKCRVINCSPAARRISISFNITPTKFNSMEAEVERIKPGSLVSGVIEQVSHQMIVVDIHEASHIKGTISLEHLADHHGLAALMMSVLKPGYHFDQLLVLDIEGNNFVLTAKYSLVNSAQQLPVDITQIRHNTVVPGYICNIIETGCFVRFIGRLTGFSPKSKATDDRITNLSEVFFVGQSVRSNIVDVSREMGRITLSLKQSLCCSADSSFIREYFLLEDKIAKLQPVNSGVTGLSWIDEFYIGSVVKGKVLETKEFGVVVSFEKYDDVYGFISHYQLAQMNIENNSIIEAAIIDVSKVERLVDLTLKPEFMNRSNKEASIGKTHKKRKREAHTKLELNQSVNAVVEIVKENYLVLSIPTYNFAIGYASLTDYNSQKTPPKQFMNGQSITVAVAALPNPATSERLLLVLKSLTDSVVMSSSKRVKNMQSFVVGSLVQVEITRINSLELGLKFGCGFHGRIHVTEATDDNSSEFPFNIYKIGQTITAMIVSRDSKSEHSKGSYRWELSIKPSILRESNKINDLQLVEDFKFSYGQHVSGFVYKTGSEWVWVTISRHMSAQLYILDSSCDPSELEDFPKKFHVGERLSGYVISMTKEKKLLRLVLHPVAIDPLEQKRNSLNSFSQFHIVEGTVVGGRISKILPGVGGLFVQIDKHVYGKVHFTELTNTFVSNPLAGYYEGQFVRCKVLDINRTVKDTIHVDLSLRYTSDDSHCVKFSELSNGDESSTQRVNDIIELHPSMDVQGYVKSISSKGCFVMLSRKIDAKILLSNLSDNFVDNPENDFPVGKLVSGKVLLVEALSKRVELTLKTSTATRRKNSVASSFVNIDVGDIVSGRIKRVETYGLFISIDQTNVVGLSHISELSDDRMDNIEAKFKAGARVTAIVLKVDKEKNRVSLGMKKSYFSDEISQKMSAQVPDISMENSSVDTGPKTLPLDSSGRNVNNTSDFDSELHSTPPDFEYRSLIPPLEVPLDDAEILDNAVGADESVSNATVTESNVGKNKRAKKKHREEREREIRDAEDRLLEKGIPKSVDEFEKLVRSSPNSSFIWIKYMAYLLSLTDVEKARCVAERALRTINIQEDSEKLNIWIAFFNLENEYGNPAEEAVVKLFQRALQYCDSKKVHLALLGMYERTEQQGLANDLLNKMSRKFKHSCKVWLSRIQFSLKQNSDEIQPIVNRALLSLPRRKHIQFISRTAIIEFKCGLPDRGRSMFEGMLREYPKRTDLWSIYLDQEICQGDVDVIRALFERAISLSLPPKKMKFLFKKYLEYEKSIGDKERIESVKKAALDYVESVLA